MGKRLIVDRFRTIWRAWSSWRFIVECVGTRPTPASLLITATQDYLVRWVNVAGGHTISWSIQPRKKTINFGVFRRDATPSPGRLPESSTAVAEPAPGPGSTPGTSADSRRARHASNATVPDSNPSAVVEKLRKLGMTCVAWAGRCEADRVSMGEYAVPEDQEGMYGLVFDNTHSKQFSKSVTFVLMTYPTNAPHKSGHHMHFAQTMAGKDSNSTAGGKRSPRLRARSDSSDSLDNDPNRVVLADPRPKSNHGMESVTSLGGSFYTGVLSKKRRKRNQGYARRFFSLDFTSSTLSYYKNRNSSALRGAIPLSLAVIGANHILKQISVDSGAEIWILRAPNQQDLEGWLGALRRAADSEQGPQNPISRWSSTETAAPPNPAEDREWKHVESLVGRVAGITDAVRRLAKDTDPKYAPGQGAQHTSDPTSPAEAPNDYFLTDNKPERNPFWRRKSSSQPQHAGQNFKRTVSGHRLAPPSPDPSGSFNVLKRQSSVPAYSSQQGSDVHEHCMQILRDLDTVVASFSSLIQQSRQRRTPARPEAVSRASIDSTANQEFFDAKEDKDDANSAFFSVGHERDEEEEPELDRDDDDAASVDSASTVSNDDVRDGDNPRQPHLDIFPGKPNYLSPLPHEAVSRRSNIAAAKGAPPSLVTFMRKNLGKDLSTIAMPVTANEPLSLLQRSAESLEHSHLLNSAAAMAEQSPDAEAKRLLYVTAFAVSPLSNSRARERAIRKPFNPMLGETYELVREDLGFRFVGEKVSHRPVRVAFQADGGPPASKTAAWTHTQAPAISQKFWGKSAELITEGTARVRLHESRECYSWTPAHCFLRNIIAGDKYMEPIGTMTITEEVSGRRAIVTFKSGGMFSGRSEEVSVEAFDSSQQPLALGLKGKWTTHLMLTGPGGKDETIWEAGKLVDGAPARYGMTQFAVGLNEVTKLEEHALPPTDSRLRPDQQAYEEGDVDRAEELKHKLEEAQRRRRMDMEREGEKWEAKWFVEQGGEGEAEGVWKLRDKDGYWDVREAVLGFKGGHWDGVRDVFEL